MARVFQRPPEKEWWLDYSDGTGRHRVKTTTTSKRAAEDLLIEKLADLKRQKLGLEVLPDSRVKTVDDAWRMWLEKWCPEGSKDRETRRYNANVKGSWLAAVKLSHVTGEMLDKWFSDKRKTQAARTVNGHRRILRGIYNALTKRRLFRGLNPVKETSPLEESEYAYEVLTEAELQRLLPHVPPDWRPIFALAFTTGLRRGEIYALRKDRTVVDLERGVLTPRASNRRELPKGKRVKSIPLTPEALKVLASAWEEAEWGGLLFPGPDGELRSEHLRPGEVLRSAMARAGMVEGWQHVCRSCKGVEVKARDEQQRKCPRCERIMWPKPIVRHVRFHDLRHSTASHLLDKGVDLADVQQMLRHATIAVTEKHYRHRTVEALRRAVTKPSAGTLERHLEALAESQPPEVVAVLKEAREKLALLRHQASNVVPLSTSKHG